MIVEHFQIMGSHNHAEHNFVILMDSTGTEQN